MEKTLLDSLYLKKQLIAYIGNKRAILPFFYDIFSSLSENKSVFKFIDALARTLQIISDIVKIPIIFFFIYISPQIINS